MKTTDVLVEQFAGGVLILASLFFVVTGAVPEQLSVLIMALNEAFNNAPKEFVLGLATIVLAAAAYGVALLAEYGSLAFFAPTLDRIKLERMKKYLVRYADQIKKSELLIQFNKSLDAAGVPEVDVVGQMRFEVIRRDTNLYRSIELEISRLRLVRVLFFVEALTGLGLVLRLSRGVWPWQAGLLLFSLVLGLLFLNWKTVKYRFNMYCRSIERSYRILVLDAPTPKDSGFESDPSPF